ncbi:hypothetical protein MVEN_00560400 [Mycena venus]|uniref:Uncharacterized protein n=1 Tax=Mycena venus TaxID=2733690 RepID=A0A8H6YNA4_9AGAR|nr:hypothetical protein MVEN_00560400 [Mycena venus]
MSSNLPLHPPSQNQLVPPWFLPSDQPPTRKRTLSEFMEEQEKVRDRERALKRAPYYYRQPERSMSDDSFMPVPYNPGSTRTTQSKSSRKRTTSCSSPGRGFFTETAIAEPPKPSTSASSPVRAPRKPFVVPDWARTDTTTKPRLSDRTVQKVQQKELEKELKTKEARRKKYLESKQPQRQRLGDKPRTSVTTVEPRPSGSTFVQGTKPGVQGLPLPAPVAARGEFPVFAKEQTPRLPFATLPVESPSRSASQNNIPPCTPPRKRRANTVSTPGAPTPGSLFTPDGNSLFTPASGTWGAGRALNLGRRSVSPSSRKASTQESEQTQPSEQPESEDDDRLGQELESAFDDLDFPPSSLPIASSDIDVDVRTEQMPSSSQEYDSDDSDDDDDAPPKQHWVGLPPSSPPPASSPILGASPMEDDVEELPLSTPNAAEQETPNTEVTDYSMEELGNLFNIDDFAGLFPSSTTVSADTANFFDQFTDSNVDDASQPMQEWGFDAANPQIDFTEFWESVKPLVEGSSQALDASFGFEQPDAEEIDHSKLASDVHALFSGCLV